VLKFWCEIKSFKDENVPTKTDKEVIVPDEETTTLATESNAELDFLLGTLAAEQETKAAPYVVPRVAVYLHGKKGTEHGATKGFWIDHLNGKDYEVDITSMRIYRLDLPVIGRIMWPFNSKDGSKLQGAEHKDPWCGSSDGLAPRQGDRFNYVGQSYVDYRDGQSKNITHSCIGCPFQAWLPMYDENGTAVMERDRSGNLQRKSGKPPCDPTPKFPIFDFDRRKTLLLQTSGFVRNTHILGATSRSRYGAIQGLNDFFNVDPKTGRPPIVDAGGNIHAVIMSIKNVQTDYGFQPAPTFSVDPNAITADELSDLFKYKKMYNEMDGRAVISGHGFRDFDGDDGQTYGVQYPEAVLNAARDTSRDAATGDDPF
jgi:hypothetical protein